MILTGHGRDRFHPVLDGAAFARFRRAAAPKVEAVPTGVFLA
jgi:hypothetical protein